MSVGRQPVEVRLTPTQTIRMERMGETLWPAEKLSAADVTRRLALTQLLWAESERGMVGADADPTASDADYIPRFS
jgi:hypothetical protein